MSRRLSFIILIFVMTFLAACSSDAGDSQNNNVGVTPGPTRPPTATPGPPSTLRPDQLTATVFVREATQAASAQQTAPASAQDCAPGIISEPDPATSNALTAAFNSAGVTVSGVTTLVTSNRVDCNNSTIVNTFIQVTMSVATVQDNTALGNMAADALGVFTRTTVPQPATMTLQFESANDTRSLIVNYVRAQELVASGERGAALITLLDQ